MVQETQAPVAEVVAEKPAAPDWQKQAEALQGELASLKERFAASTQQPERGEEAERKLSELEALILRNGDLVEALVEHVANPDADPAVLRQRVVGVRAKDAETQSKARIAAVREGYLVDMRERLAEVGMEFSDPRLTEAGTLWTDGERDGDLHKLFQATKKVASVVRKAQAEAHGKALDEAKQETQKVRQEYNRETNSLETGSRGGAPGSRPVATAENIDSLWVAWDRDRPNEPNPYDAQYRQFVRSGQI